MNKLLAQFKLLGIIFIAMLVGAVYLTYAIFTHKFTSYDRVTLDSSSIGLQLPDRADIKIRGVEVGVVLDTVSDGGQARLTLGIYPDKIKEIPANVSADIIPKTLFGEKYVSLQIPQSPRGTLAKGDTITQGRVSTEVEEVLSDLYPLLTKVQPGEINETLNAISTALEGRGDELGQTLVTADAYLKRVNPQIPLLINDLDKAAKTSDIYSSVLPQLGDILDNTVKTTGTLKAKQQQLHDLFNSVTGLSGTLRTFLSDNEDNLVQGANLAQTSLRVLARYSPEFPCLLKGIVNAGKYQAKAFRGFELHIVLETLPNQPRGYGPQDKPHYGADSGPHCLALPALPNNQSNVFTDIPNFDDGVNSPTGKGTDRVTPGFTNPNVASATTSSSPFGGNDGFVGSSYENELYRNVVAPAIGVPSTDVGDLADLLVAPLARGAKVKVTRK